MSNTVRIAVEPAADNPTDVCAMELLQGEDGSPIGGREVIVERDDAADFMADCSRWDWVVHQYKDTNGETVRLTVTDRYYRGYSVVLTIDADDWERWVEEYGIAEDSETSGVATEDNAAEYAVAA